jgi:hypothetical protein
MVRAQALDDLQRGDASADDDRVLRRGAAADDLARVGQIVELDHAVQLDAGHSGRHGGGPCGSSRRS